MGFKISLVPADSQEKIAVNAPPAQQGPEQEGTVQADDRYGEWAAAIETMRATGSRKKA